MSAIGLYDLEEPLRKFPGAIFGTCAGMILMARDGLMGQVDIDVSRNAYGRQVASFEADGVVYEGYTRVRPLVPAPHPAFDARLL